MLFYSKITHYIGITRYTLNIAQILLLFVILLPSCSFAETACKAGNNDWNPPSAGPITTWTAPTCEKGKLAAQAFLFYNRARGVFNDEGNYKAFKNKDSKSQWQEQLFLSYGITERLDIGALGTYQQNRKKQDGISAKSSGFSDTYMYASYCLFMEKKWIPCISGWFQLKIPSGKYQKADAGKLGIDLMGAASGGGSYDTGYGFILTKKIKPFIFHADAIWNFPIKTKVDGAKTQYAAYTKCDFGAEYFFYKGFNLMLELNGYLQGDRKVNSGYVPASDINYLTISPGIGWSCKKIQTLLAYQRTLAGTNTDANDSVVLTAAYTF